jgi:dTDP-4-amino-4,6-dideoxygalactose transaminase
MITRIRPFLNTKKLSKLMGTPISSEVQTITRFENMFASYLGAYRAIAVHQGRSALLLALKVLNIGHGDEVIAQSHIYHVVIDAIMELGAKPVLVDSNIYDFNISAEAVKKAMTPRTKAIIAAHLGLPCDIEKISDIAKSHNCFLIENCAHTLGGLVNGRNAGTFGDLSFFSFDVDKPFTTGDGGMLVINNDNLMERTEQVLKQYKRVPLNKELEMIYGLFLYHYVTSEDVYPRDGFLPVDFGKTMVRNDSTLLALVEKAVKSKADGSFQEFVLPYLIKKELLNTKLKTSWLKNMASRIYGRAMVTFGAGTIAKIDSSELLMNSMRSFVGIECLKDYDKARQIRNSNAQYYIDHLDKMAFREPLIKETHVPAFIRYSVLNNTKYSNAMISSMAKEKGFELGIFNWSAPIHLCYPYSRRLSFDRNELCISEYLGKKLLSLPIHPYVNGEAIKQITQFLNQLAK